MIDLYTSALRSAGYRVTTQRRLICAYLAKTDRHPTPYEIYADLTREHPEISQATVYNTLGVLRDLGVIVRVGSGADQTHYETDPTPHINLICLRCHSISDLEHDLPLEDVERMIYAETGFQPVSARLDVLGFCADCRARKRTEIIEEYRTRRAHREQRRQEKEESQ